MLFQNQPAHDCVFICICEYICVHCHVCFESVNTDASTWAENIALKKIESDILKCCLHHAVPNSQLKCSHKRKYNCVTHLVALARECVISHSS